MKKIFMSLSLLGFSVAATSAYADKQVLTSDPTSVQITKGSTDEFSIKVAYDTDPSGSKTTGIGVKVFFDSSKLTFVSMANNSGEDTIAATLTAEEVAGSPDSSNADNDSNTDYFANIAWTSFGGSFPAPISNLFTVTFKPATTSFEGTTNINYANLSLASGYEASAESVVITFAGDTVDPQITAPSAISVDAGSADGTAATQSDIATFLAGATATDNLDGDISSSITNDAPSTFPIGATTVTFSIADSSNNVVTATAVVTVADKTGPTVVAPESITVAATDANGTAATDASITSFLNSASASDAVDGSVAATNNAPETFPLGDTKVTFTSTDAAGNGGSASATVKVTDQTAPTLTVANLTIEATSAEGATPDDEKLLSSVSAEDNVDTSVTVTSTNSGSTFAIGTSTINVSAADQAGNTSTANFTLTVSDTTGPEISGNNLTISLKDGEAAPLTSVAEVTSWIETITATDIVDGTVSVTNDLASGQLSEGSNAVKFTAVDAAGNTTTSDLSIMVYYGPAVSVPAAITIVSANSTAISSSNATISAFIASASATDAVGTALTVSNNAPTSFDIGTTTITFSATDDQGQEGSAQTSITILAPAEENDTDGDGMDDAFEVANNLDPNDKTDGALDKDGDGATNAEEYAAGTDVGVDSFAPVVTAPADIETASTGILTDVSLGAAEATDGVDGTVTASASNTGPFAIGSTQVTWSAKDAAGNVGTATQQVKVLPIVEVAALGRAAEGSAYQLLAKLNGAPTDYPVTIPVTFGGSATENTDYTASAGSISIASGLEGSITINVSADAESETENIVATLGTPSSGVALGPNSVATISIIETAVEPALGLQVSQGTNKGSTVSTSGGDVSIDLTITDPNGTHTIDWSGSDANLISSTGTASNTFTFSPATMSAGSYKAAVEVADSGISDSVFSASVVIVVKEEEVKADSDGDGVPDEVDLYTEPNIISAGGAAAAPPASTDIGMTIVLGGAATASGATGLTIDESTVGTTGGDGLGEASNGNDGAYNYPGGVYDFVVLDLPVPGQSINVVLPVQGGIPANAIYRKFVDSKGWFTFVSDDKNFVSSSLGTPTSCPSAGSASYEKGLKRGDYCIQLTIEDGGENDADGSVNGIVDDPGGIAVDDLGPLVTAPDGISVQAESAQGVSVTNETVAAFLAGATAFDTTDGDVTYSITNDAGDFIPVGDTTVTFYAMDTSGNFGLATAVVTVIDGSPVLTAPANITVEAESASGVAVTNESVAAFLAGATASDNADGDLSASIISDAGEFIALGDVVVTFSVTDSAGNEVTATAVVTVVDTTAPEITAPSPITVRATSGTGIASSDSAIASFLSGARATDLVDSDVTITNNAPSNFAVGAVTVTFTATDDAGNSSTASAVVTVNKKKDSGGGGFGCSAGSGNGPIDPMLPILVLLAALGACRRRLIAALQMR